MTEELKKELNELFPDWQPVLIEDDEGIDFDKPIKGKYIARIAGLSRYSGTCKDGVTPYDMASLNLQVVEVVEGDSAMNRYVGKTYGCIDGQYSTAEEDLKKLLNDLFTADLLSGLNITRGGFEGIFDVADQLVDKTMKISCWATKKGKQAVKVVKEHKVKSDSSSEVSDSDW